MFLLIVFNVLQFYLHETWAQKFCAYWRQGFNFLYFNFQPVKTLSSMKFSTKQLLNLDEIHTANQIGFEFGD